MSYNCWMGWIRFECGYEYLDPRGLSRMQVNGHAYGMYQFDYAGGLVPFMQACVAYNSSVYAGFNQYIALGQGNTQLINNSGLHSLFEQYATYRTNEFQMLQDTEAINNYLDPIINLVYQNYGYYLQYRGPYVLGSAFSMAIRSGANPAYQFFANGASMAVPTLLTQAYNAQSNVYYDNGRWDTSIPNPNYSQFQRLQDDMAGMSSLYIIPYGSVVPPGPPHGYRGKLPIWMMCNKNYRIERK